MNKFKIFLIALLLGVTFYAKSQNTGPVSPESMSFEPIDANNMVSPLTGDFSYVIPLLNVPSPEGGYPIALSYHGGISMDQEASWVGLGWNINPGAITRNVNGYPDDWKEKYATTITYMPGEVIETNTLGVDVGLMIGGKAVMSIGVAYTWGSFKAIGINMGANAFGVGANASYNSYNGGSWDKGVGAGIGPLQLTKNWSGSKGGSDSYGMSLTAGGGNSVGVTISSGKAYGSISAAGVGVSSFKGDNNENGGNMDISGFSITVPLKYCTVRYSHQRIRFWYYNDYSDVVYGLLYSNLAKEQANWRDNDFNHEAGVQNKNSRMDTYAIPFSESTVNEKNSDLLYHELIMAAPDNYGITAQGISGNLTPRNYTNNLLTYNSQVIKGSTTNDIVYYNTFPTFSSSQSYDPQFYVDNEIAGYISATSGDFSGNGHPNNVYNYGGSINTTLEYKGKTYAGFVNGKKVSANYVEWFTNEQINTGIALSKGFLDNKKIYSQRTNSNLYDAMGIGGFKITALDGKTYHYALPVYQFEEFLRKNGKVQGHFYETRKLDTYATSWLLTAVTGPDYFDKNNNGFADDGDYGYWVNFEYGKLTDGYIWQLPYDLAGKTYETYPEEIRWGRKQIYYLNSIETRTHKALFIKETREDGLGKHINAAMNKTNVQNWACRYIPKGDWLDSKTNSFYSGDMFRNYSRTTSYSYSNNNEEVTLKLKEILLLKKGNSNSVNPAISSSSNVNSSGTLSINDEITVYNVEHNALEFGSHHEYDRTLTKTFTRDFSSNYNDVLMTDNVSNLADLEAKSIKKINFTFSYDLCKGAPNSKNVNKGKLTLKGLNIRGRNDKRTLPPYIFNYNNEDQYYTYSDYTDLWGYALANTDNWCLREVIMPTGGKIKINYEKNTFKNEAIYGERLPIVRSWFVGGTAYIKVAADINSFKVNDNFTISGEVKYVQTDVDPNTILTQQVSGIATVASIGQDSTITFSTPASFPQYSSSIENKSIIGFIVNLPAGFSQYGGGVRVASIQTVDELNNTYGTEYKYTIPNTNYTSGTICYSPYYYDKKYIPYFTELPSPKVLYKYVTVTQTGNGAKGLSTIYEFDAYKNATYSYLDFTMGDQFKVINSQPALIIGSYGSAGYNYGNLNARHAIIYNNLSSVGRLKAITQQNTLNQKTISQIYTYYEPEDVKIGYQQEQFSYVKRNLDARDISVEQETVKISASNNEWYYGSASRVNYQNVPKSIIVESNGNRRETSYDMYDFYTGNVLSTITKDIDDKLYKTEVVPAYKLTSYSSMGSKSVDPTFKNMLSQEAASLSYVKVGDSWKPVGVSVQTWKNSWVDRINENVYTIYHDQQLPNVWRKYKTFSWKGSLNEDGTYSSGFDPYSTTDLLIAHWNDFNGDGINGWQKTSEVTRYNKYSQPLEAIDINGHAASSKLDVNETQTIASALNAGYDGFSFCGFEKETVGGSTNLYDGGFYSQNASNARYLCANALNIIGGTKIPNITAHTGCYYQKVLGCALSNGNSGGPEVQISYSSGRKYKVSVWVHKNSTNANLGMYYIPANGSVSNVISITMDDTNSKLFGDWKLFSAVFTMPTLAVNGNVMFYFDCEGSGNFAYIDDFRVQPVDASTSAYVYDPITDAITYILNNDNIATKYQYDDAGNLTATYKETPSGFKMVSLHNQGFVRPLGDAITLSNIVSRSSVNSQGERAAGISFDLTNNDVIDRTVNLDVKLTNKVTGLLYGTKKVIVTVGSMQTITQNPSFSVPGFDNVSATFDISGDVNISQSITIDGIPPILTITFSLPYSNSSGSSSQVSSSEANENSSDPILNTTQETCNIIVRATITNIGSPETITTLGWTVNGTPFLNAGTFYLGHNQTTTVEYTNNFKGNNTIGMKYGGSLYPGVQVYCADGIEPPTVIPPEWY